MTITTLPTYDINPTPSSEELKQAKELVEKGKEVAKLKSPQNGQEAWENLDQAIKDIREDFNRKNE